MIPLKSEEDLQFLRESGLILARALKDLEAFVAAGVRTREIDARAEDLLLKEKARPAFKGYRGYPASVCVSVNEEIVHGIPGDRKIAQGDIVSIDLGVDFRGYFTDAAVTVPVGEVDAQKRKLIEVAKKALFAGIKQAAAGNHLLDISYSIQNFVEKNGFSVVRQFVGHGIGSQLHEEPEIPNFGRQHHGPLIKKGMVFAIEPMVNMGTWESEVLANGWTAVTRDRLPSAHFEHTVAITDKGAEILTQYG